jgi:predicted TIM-barrel fold metal-dependent hydrolase
MRIIDSHVHLYPAELNAAPAAWAAAHGEGHWSVLCTRQRRDGRPVQAFPAVAELLRELDAGGIERAVLLGWYWQRPENCAWQNRFLAECVRAHPDRLEAFATIHPGAGRAETLAEITRARDDGLVGLGELSPHSQGYAIDDPVFRAALDCAAELGLPVNLHVTDPAGRSYPGRIETPLADFLRLAADFPSLQFVLAHWGGLLALGEGGVARALPANVHFDTAASPLLYGPEIWAQMAPFMDRVLFGSDFPLDLYPRQAEANGLNRFVAEARAHGAGAGVMGENYERLITRTR